MIIKEYRIVMPLSVEEYQIGQLFSIAEASKNETGGGEGVEVIKNEPFFDFPLMGGAYNSGQYTEKIYHLKSKVPTAIKMVAPAGSLTIHEKSWNAYPYCRTELSNPDYMGDKFYVRIETIHLNDRGTTENALNLPDEILSKRTVVDINIANDKEFLARADVKPDTSPHLFLSQKTGRGRLDPKTWRQSSEPVMCAYKLVTVYFKWFGFQNLVEGHAHKQYPRLFAKFHREIFCWIDHWYGLNIEQIRAIEKALQKELDDARKSKTVRGMSANSE